MISEHKEVPFFLILSRELRNFTCHFVRLVISAIVRRSVGPSYMFILIFILEVPSDKVYVF